MFLTAGLPALALDERAAAAMRRWIERLGKIQDDMASRPPPDLSLSLPRELEPEHLEEPAGNRGLTREPYPRFEGERGGGSSWSVNVGSVVHDRG
jgi:hypothetical protein